MENAHTKWEFLKFEIRKFTIDYSKTIASKGKKKRSNLELKLRNPENNLNCEVNRKYITVSKIIYRLFMIALSMA